MPEHIEIQIDRPMVGIRYIPESIEAEILDELAACELGFHAMSQHIIDLRKRAGLRVPDEVMAVFNSNAGQRGL